MSWLDRMIARDLEREKELVTHPQSLGPVVRSMGAIVAVLVAAFGAIFAGEPFAVFGQLVIATVAGLAVSSGLRRKTAFRNGWLEGRRQMVEAMLEAQRRGLSPADWMRSEAERDAAVLGIDARDLLGEGDE